MMKIYIFLSRRICLEVQPHIEDMVTLPVISTITDDLLLFQYSRLMILINFCKKDHFSQNDVPMTSSTSTYDQQNFVFSLKKEQH